MGPPTLKNQVRSIPDPLLRQRSSQIKLGDFAEYPAYRPSPGAVADIFTS